MARIKKDKTRCIGCHNNFYNGHNPYSIKECWNYKAAKMQTRYRICNSTPQNRADAFYEVVVMSCRCEEGYSLYKEIPQHLQAEWKAKLKERKRIDAIAGKQEVSNDHKDSI